MPSRKHVTDRKSGQNCELVPSQFFGKTLNENCAAFPFLKSCNTKFSLCTRKSAVLPKRKAFARHIVNLECCFKKSWQFLPRISAPIPVSGLRENFPASLFLSFISAHREMRDTSLSRSPARSFLFTSSLTNPTQFDFLEWAWKRSQREFEPRRAVAKCVEIIQGKITFYRKDQVTLIEMNLFLHMKGLNRQIWDS